MEKIKWILITQKQYPIFSRQWMTESFRDEMRENLGCGFQNYKSLFSGIYADEKEFENLKKLLILKLKKNPKTIEKILENWEKSCDELLNFVENLNENWANFSDKKLLNLAEKILQLFKKSASFLFAHHAFSKFFENWLQKILVEKNLPKKYFQILTTSEKKTGIFLARKNLEKLQILAEKKGIENIKKEIENYAKKFSWLGFETGIGKNLTAAEIISKIKNLPKNPEIKKISQQKILEKLKLNSQQKFYFSLLQKSIFLPAFRAEIHSIAGFYFRPILENLAEKIGTNHENLVQLTFSEIKNILKNKKKIDFLEIEKRKKKFGILMLNGKIEIFSGDAVDEIDEKIFAPKNQKEISGMPACGGKISGIAKIVITTRDFQKIKKGDILVAKMTSPDFMVVLPKCAGIVTDIGGITCHAAIISREMKIPCIIGTKFATKFFKDDEKIEIDADAGVVKKI